jgi:ATP-binding cassette subfamily F protein 3
MIQINNLYKSFGTQKIFENITFTIGNGEKIGLVGRNGSGKSTLLSMIKGDLSPDSGTISCPKTYIISALPQHIFFTKKTVIEECITVLKKENYDDYKAEKILFGLGFSEKDLQKNPQLFSGGQQLRINLTKLLLEEANMLLLDEPSNYLDITSLRWLKGFLQQYTGEFLLVTHDREFMDSVVTHVAGINRNNLKKIKGVTEKYYEQMALEDDIYDKTVNNLEIEKAKLEGFIDRFRAKASKATQAQSKIKKLEKLPTISKLMSGKFINFSFSYKECPGKDIMNTESISFTYKNGPEIVNDFSYSLKNGDRVAIIGKNGKGKSTLLNLFSGDLGTDSGTICFHSEVKIGHFGQTNILRLDLQRSIIEEIQSANSLIGIKKVRSICGAMAFEGDTANKKISVLSGGEKSRVLLGKILATESNLLLLDEPTNHLDMETIEILLLEIQKYKGAVILVTHNEGLLRKFAQRLIIFQNKEVLNFEGSYDYFLEKIGYDDEPQNTVLKSNKMSKRELKKKRSEIIKERSSKLKPLKEKIDYLEEEISFLEEEETRLNHLLIKASEEEIKDEIITIARKLDDIKKTIDQHFSQLENIIPEYEDLEKKYDSYLEDLSK